MVEVIKTTAEFHVRRNLDKDPIGFVATMGNLHSGHMSLLEEGLKDFQTVYFSIFVNPKQFGPNEDFNRYPRTLEQDIALIEKQLSLHPGKKVVLFAPADPTEVFPPEDNQNISVWGINKILEGEFRPTHFDGVATVVYKLFKLIKPTKSYFGIKDFQQLAVIKMMVKDLQLPIIVKGMPIIREESGLALSSRNQYLSETDKEKALILNRTLKEIISIIDGKKSNVEKARLYVKGLMEDLNWNYLEIRDVDSLSSDITDSKELTLLGVYQLGTTRLLDNMQVEVQ